MESADEKYYQELINDVENVNHDVFFYFRGKSYFFYHEKDHQKISVSLDDNTVLFDTTGNALDEFEVDGVILRDMLKEAVVEEGIDSVY